MKIKRFSSAFLGMNSALLIKDDNVILIDPGVFPDEIDNIIAYMDQNFLKPVANLLTHTHGDHFGGWHGFESIPTYIGESFLRKDKKEIESDLKFARGLYKKHKADDNLIKFPEFDAFLESGKITHLENFRILSLATPGHAVDLTTYILPDDGIMATGDMLVAIPVPYILNSVPDYKNSLNLLKEHVIQYEIQTLIPGHAHFAHSQAEILERIRNESDYLNSVLEKVLPVLENEIENENLSERLKVVTQEWIQYEAHLYNLNTIVKQKFEILKYFS